jgi:hypothetical protein
MFDDAIIYAKEALKTMNYGAGRMTLATALFGKAAELIDAGKAAEADKYVVQAKYMGSDPRDVLERLEGSSDSVDRLMPTLRKIIN